MPKSPSNETSALKWQPLLCWNLMGMLVHVPVCNWYIRIYNGCRVDFMNYASAHDFTLFGKKSCPCSNSIALKLMLLLDLTDKSTLFQVMTWCHPATSHYLNQCWPRFMCHMVSLPQWVNKTTLPVASPPVNLKYFLIIRLLDNTSHVKIIKFDADIFFPLGETLHCVKWRYDVSSLTSNHVCIRAYYWYHVTGFRKYCYDNINGLVWNCSKCSTLVIE